MRRVWITLCLCSIVALSSIVVAFAQSHARLKEYVSSPSQSVCECVISEESPISYEIKDETERRGSEIIHFYSLWVKNQSGQDLYIHGKVHLLGTVQRRPFAGTVPANKKKCIFSTIDEDFEVEEIYYQESLGF